MFAHIRRLYFILPGVFFTNQAFADDSGASLADVVATLMVGGNILSKLMWAGCIVVGVALIAAAFTQFQIHRRNPKLVPLTTPILYLLLGIISIALPFLGQAEGFLGPGQQGIKSAPAAVANHPNYNPNDIDAPIN